MALDEFFSFLQFERRYSQHTLKSYRTDLKQFEKYLDVEYELKPAQAKASEIRAWLSLLIAGGLSPKSVNRKISSLKSYFRFLETRNKLDTNPMFRVSAPRMPRKLPVFVPENDMATLFDDFEFTKDFAGLRDRLMIEILYGTGIRLSELVNLAHKDVDLHQEQLKVKGKGSKERIIPMLKPLSNIYGNYLNAKKQLFEFNTTDKVFVTDQGKKIYPKFVYRVVNFYLSNHTTVSKRSPHILRHTFATHMLSKGADLNAIKELLGHASLNATQIYTHNTVEKLKSVYKQAHPKA